jgi:hypothetical protein
VAPRPAAAALRRAADAGLWYHPAPMIELGLLKRSLADLQERIVSLRGFL